MLNKFFYTILLKFTIVKYIILIDLYIKE